MSGRRVAIACQGGGSQCAFVAGALGALFRQDVHRRFEIVGLSGVCVDRGGELGGGGRREVGEQVEQTLVCCG